MPLISLAGTITIHVALIDICIEENGRYEGELHLQLLRPQRIVCSAIYCIREQLFEDKDNNAAGLRSYENSFDAEQWLLR